MGTSWCVISMTCTYYVLCHVVDDHHMYYFACYLFASIAGAVSEGITFQVDNFICTMNYFSWIIFLNTIFMTMGDGSPNK